MSHPIRVAPPPIQSLQPSMPVMKGLQAASETAAAVAAAKHNPAVLHPVFFAENLQRAPLVVDAALASPVALGYGYPKGGPRL